MNYNRKIRTAVVGLGRIAWHFHIPSIVSNDGFELAAVVDPQPDRLQDVRDKYTSVQCFSNTKEMYSSDQYDLVVIASPTCFHYDQVIEAFAHQCDVFCDKPLAVEYQHCVSIAEAMKKSARKLMVYQPHRITNVTTGLKQIVQSGLLGNIYMVKRSECAFDRRNDWQAFTKNGGGMLYNYGAHYIDQLFHVFGGKCKELNCITKRIATLGDAEDVVRLTLQTDQNIIFDIDINMAAACSAMPWCIYGDRGTAWINSQQNCWEVKYFEPDSLSAIRPQKGLFAANREYGNGTVTDWKTRQFSLDADDSIDFYDYCFDYFAQNNQPFVPIDETLEVMRVINLCRKDKKQGLYFQDKLKKHILKNIGPKKTAAYGSKSL